MGCDEVSSVKWKSSGTPIKIYSDIDSKSHAIQTSKQKRERMRITKAFEHDTYLLLWVSQKGSFHTTYISLQFITPIYHLSKS